MSNVKKSLSEKIKFSISTTNTSQSHPSQSIESDLFENNTEFSLIEGNLKYEEEVITPQFNLKGNEIVKVDVDISHFDLLKVIGIGSFGKVLLVRHKENNQVLAIKCVKKENLINSKKVLENLKNEKKVLELVECPFIIKLKCTFQDHEKIYLAFEYHNGGDLFFHLQKNKKFSEEIVKFYAAELYIALQHLHSKNIVYR